MNIGKNSFFIGTLGRLKKYPATLKKEQGYSAFSK